MQRIENEPLTPETLACDLLERVLDCETGHKLTLGFEG